MGEFIKVSLLTPVVSVLASLVEVFYVGASVYHQDPLNLVANSTTDRRGSLDFLLIGVDSRDRSWDNPRLDAMMLVHLDKTNKSISLIFIPRDTRTKTEGRKHREEINHAFACEGSDLSLKTVS